MMAVLWNGATMGQDDAAKKDLAKFQGTWSLVSGERDGKKLSEEETKKTKNVYDGEKFQFPDAFGSTQKGTIKLDASKNPKWVDSTDASTGQVRLGIYEFTEAGLRRMCLAPAGKPRPTEFSSKPGSGNSYMIWQRADADAIQGAFTLISGEVKGEKMPEEIVKNATNVIEGNKHTVHVGSDAIVGTHVMDSTKTPKEIDSTDTAGPFKGQKYLGIYKFENGVYTVCFAAPGKDRPKEFTTKSGTGELMHVWKKK
ncbi:MAG: hypothetical protein RIS70_3956 [Planctomycetota bacterium]|jgi:uncharacterized protein (TIGR03067 family)